MAHQAKSANETSSPALQFGVPLSPSTLCTTDVPRLPPGANASSPLRDSTLGMGPNSAPVHSQPPAPVIVPEAPTRTPVEGDQIRDWAEHRLPFVQGSPATTVSEPIPSQAGSTGSHLPPSDVFPEQSSVGQDASMAQTEIAATSEQVAGSSHGGSTRGTSSPARLRHIGVRAWWSNVIVGWIMYHQLAPPAAGSDLAVDWFAVMVVSAAEAVVGLHWLWQPAPHQLHSRMQWSHSSPTGCSKGRWRTDAHWLVSRTVVPCLLVPTTRLKQREQQRQ
nr:hypothetical protein Iba_scaffold3961.4CG1350 [Ipomoea batatas]